MVLNASEGPRNTGNALFLCKPYQVIARCGVRSHTAPIFHRLIHTCVENFMRVKYFLKDSARIVLTAGLRRWPLKNQSLFCEKSFAPYG